jgi:hypothetical protein
VSVLALASSVDDLYRRAVEEPAGVDDVALADWMEGAAELLGGPPDRPTARILRRVIRDARKLVAYWAERDCDALADWRSGVDETLGSRGWEPQLDLVAAAVEGSRDRETFEEMHRRYRAVHFQPWRDGVTYEEWSQESS